MDSLLELRIRFATPRRWELKSFFSNRTHEIIKFKYEDPCQTVTRSGICFVHKTEKSSWLMCILLIEKMVHRIENFLLEIREKHLEKRDLHGIIKNWKSISSCYLR